MSDLGSQDTTARGPRPPEGARPASEGRTTPEGPIWENEQLFRIISDHAGDLVSLITREGRRVFQNRAYLRQLGYTEDELAAGAPLALIDPADVDRVRSALRDVFATGREITLQYGMMHRNGSVRHVESRITPVASAERDEGLAVVVGRDVTDRVAVDLDLLRAHAIKNLVLENSSLGIAFIRKRRIEWANSRCGELLGKPMKDIVGHSTRVVYPDDEAYRRKAPAIYAAFERGEPTDDLWEIPRTDGSRFWCRLVGRALDPSRPDEGSVWMFEDITARVVAEQERLSLEVQLRQAQKLEAIGQLAAGIAHEINTPTQYVGDNLKFLLDAFRDLQGALDAWEAQASGALGGAEARLAREEADLPYLRDEIPRALEQSLEGIARVTRIVKAMKDFSHPGGETMVEVDLNRSIESTVTVCRHEWKYVADIVLDLDPALPRVLCHPGEINQAVLNLVVNAAHAIADGSPGGAKGTITVTTAHRDGWAEIRVRDTGTGIPESVRARIFDPFFTTKEVGRGTGQGLAIVHNVAVERHGGTVAFETEMGRGSEFILRIPATGRDQERLP
ncbi:MAG TPA: ATP-binding protein [Holophaga sp.]|nr:ATP-binding protein [Holophaga sp.]